MPLMSRLLLLPRPQSHIPNKVFNNFEVGDESSKIESEVADTVFLIFICMV